MRPEVLKTVKIPANANRIFIIESREKLAKGDFTKDEIKYIKESEEKSITINRYGHFIFVVFLEAGKTKYQTFENLRKSAFKILSEIKSYKLNSVYLTSPLESDFVLAFTEGLVLGNYQFLKYFKDSAKKTSSLQKVYLADKYITDESVSKLNCITQAVYHSRDLVNEPSNFMTAKQLAKTAKSLCEKSGCKVEIFEKGKIESLKMGGLIAVNKGSIDPPTFTIITYKPGKAINKKPYVIVGKGLVFDTGGLSLKPTPGSMDAMKSDMAGGAAVIGAMSAISSMKLPLYVIGLVPATDNRPGQNAYAPQDIIRMHNGMTVEVLNTDAEGRMILADALSYAQQYKPELVFDLATLTGAATIATGQHGIPVMGTAGEKEFDELKESGFRVFERVVEFPLWDEYGEAIKSQFADIKNVGGREAGAITAGKFLEHFTDYPWIHMDIAGSAYLDNASSYRGKAGTGAGVRLLVDFFEKKCFDKKRNK